MKHFVKHLLLTFVLAFGPLLLVPTFVQGQSQGGTIPTIENGPYVWGGINVYTPGNLQLTSPIAPCSAGLFAIGLDETLTPICSSPGGIVNGAVVYPGQCQQGGNIPTWCGASGQTADVYYRAACAQLPAGGGTINMVGLHGIIAAPMTCSTPTKQVITLTDPTSNLTVTESDGGVTFPLDEYSMLLGPAVGNGACLPSAGIHLSSTTNITAVVGPAHTDGTQESFTANGLCILGATGATVTKGLIYAKQVFTNTTVAFNNLFECNNSCLYLDTVGGEVTVFDNWFDVGSGFPTLNGSDLIVTGESSDVNIMSNTMEHANGGANYPEIVIQGDGAGLSSSRIHVSYGYSERIINSPYTPDVTAISITDCQNCSVSHYAGQGTPGGTNFIQVSQTAPGRTANVEIDNVLATAWTNLLSDTVTGITVPAAFSGDTLAHYVVNSGFSDMPCSPLAAPSGVPYTGQCWTSPSDYRTHINAPSGQQIFAWQSDLATTPQSLGNDVMGGDGNFATGNSNFGTNFSGTGCLGSQGLTCTFTRTSSTAPPGSTFSQETTIVTNTDPNIGFNGIQWGPTVSFTAGQPYIFSVYGKGDGSFTGTPTALLWNSTIPAFYCQAGVNTPFSTTWTLYSFVCTPATTGTGFLAVVATTPVGATGSFYFGDFTFRAEQPLNPGAILTAVAPYGIGSVPGLLYSASGTPLPSCSSALKGAQFVVSDASSPTYLGTYSSGGSTTATVICNGSNWVTH